HAKHLLARDGEHAERVVRSQVVFAGEGKRSQVVQRFEIVGMNTCLIEGLLVVRDIIVGMIQRRFHPLKLTRSDFISLHTLERFPTRRKIDALELQTRHTPSPDLPVSDFPLRGVPMLFKICNERRTEMAISLFATIDGHVAAERIQRFFSDTKRTTVARSADYARAGEIFNHARDCSIHFLCWHDEIADHPSFWTIALETSAHQDRLPCGAGTDKARQTEIRRPRNDALLARRQRQIGIVTGYDVIHRQQILAAATNREQV